MKSKLLTYNNLCMNQDNTFPTLDFFRNIHIKEYCKKFMDIINGESIEKRNVREMTILKPDIMWIDKHKKAMIMHEQMMKEYDKYRNTGIYKYTIENKTYSKDIEELFDMLDEED